MVAFKEYTSKTKVFQELEREFSIVNGLDHPNIIKYFFLKSPKKEDEFGICMEYMEGGSLYKYVHDNYQNITFEEKLELAR